MAKLSYQVSIEIEDGFEELLAAVTPKMVAASLRDVIEQELSTTLSPVAFSVDVSWPAVTSAQGRVRHVPAPTKPGSPHSKPKEGNEARKELLSGEFV